MKFNKAKLAALAMSAFIGTALFGYSAFAENIADHEQSSQTTETEAPEELEEATVKEYQFYSNGTIKITYSNGIEKTYTADVLDKKDATCEEPGYVAYIYEIVEGKEVVSDKYEIPALGHKVSSTTKTEKIKEARHSIDGDEEGLYYTGYYCTNSHDKTVWMTKDGQVITDPENDPAIVKTIEEVTHIWEQLGKPRIIDTDWVELDANDQPFLVDETHGGRYEVTLICTIGGETKTEVRTLEPAKSRAVVSTVAYKNIKGYYNTVTRTVDPFIPGNPNEDLIVLQECKEPGYVYTIYSSYYWAPEEDAEPNVLTPTFLFTSREGTPIDAESLVFDGEGNVIGLKGDAFDLGIEQVDPVTIKPHHVETGKVRVTKKDDNISFTLAEPTGEKWTGYGIAIYNNSCKEEGKISIQKECAGGKTAAFEWMVAEELTIAPNPDAHKIADGYDKAKIDAAVTAMKAGRTPDWSGIKGYGVKFDGVGYPKSVEEIERLLENITATCTTAGTGEMVWYCTVCGARVKVETVPVAALGHKIGEKKENEVPATCGEPGSYEAVQYCVRCGEEYSRKEVIVPATGDHKFGDVFIAWYGEDVVDYNGRLMSAAKRDYKFGNISRVGSPAGLNAHYNQDYFVFANAEHTCSVCGQTRTVEDHVHLDIVGEVQKSSKAGYPGSITLRGYYVADGNLNKVIVEDTKTFNYYTSMDEYTARVIEPPVAPEDPEPTPVEPEEPEISLPAIDAATFKAANAGNNKVQLTWSAVEGADGYLILKNGTQIAYTTGATSYLDRNASSEEFSYYWVIPYAKTAKGTVKGELSNYVWAIGRTVLEVKALSAEATEDGIALSWEPASGANGYVVLSKSGSDKAAFNAPVEVSGTSCVIKAKAGEVQFYWVYGTYTNGDGYKVAAGKVSPYAWAVAK